MHKGQVYAFAPAYWATECFFWPGFVPWKAYVDLPADQGGGWDNLFLPINAVSGPIRGVPDWTQVYWDWNVDAPSSATRFTLSVERLKIAGKYYAAWKANLYNHLLLVAEAWFYQESPLYTFLIGQDQWWSVPNPSAPQDGIFISVRPSTWQESGQPDYRHWSL